MRIKFGPAKQRQLFLLVTAIALVGAGSWLLWGPHRDEIESTSTRFYATLAGSCQKLGFDSASYYFTDLAREHWTRDLWSAAEEGVLVQRVLFDTKGADNATVNMLLRHWARSNDVEVLAGLNPHDYTGIQFFVRPDDRAAVSNYLHALPLDDLTPSPLSP